MHRRISALAVCCAVGLEREHPQTDPQSQRCFDTPNFPSPLLRMVGFLRGLVNREPAMVLSTIIGVSALCLPFIVIPIRRSMGLPTYQWDADVETHPVRARGWAARCAHGRS